MKRSSSNCVFGLVRKALVTLLISFFLSYLWKAGKKYRDGRIAVSSIQVPMTEFRYRMWSLADLVSMGSNRKSTAFQP